MIRIKSSVIKREIQLLYMLDRDTCEKNKFKDAYSGLHPQILRIEPIIENINNKLMNFNTDLQDFAITYLEADPVYFRSGYVKEDMLAKLRKAELNTNQIIRLLSILKDAVENRGAREFKRYCKLAMKIANNDLIEFLHIKAKSINTSVKSRAKLMILYI